MGKVRTIPMKKVPTMNIQTQEEIEQQLDTLIEIRVMWDEKSDRIKRREAKYLTGLDNRIQKLEAQLS